MQSPRKLCLVAATLLVLLSGTYGVASAITNGQPDGTAHPYVGIIAFYDAALKPVNGVCSGVLVAPNVLLTAGHCTSGAKFAQAWFAPNLLAGPPKGLPGMVSTDPNYRPATGSGLGNAPNHDLGIVVLFTPLTIAKYGQLPKQALIEGLPMMSDVGLVGYGGQQRGARVPDPGNPPHKIRNWTANLQRYYAPAKLVNARDVIAGEFVKVTANPAQGKGGACLGDSGGPVLLGDTDTVLAVNSFATNGNCAGLTYASRLDTPDALKFINSFLNPSSNPSSNGQ